MSLPSARFYAVILAGRLECPACAKLLLFGTGQPHQKHYDPLTSTIKCPDCHRAYTLGVIAWKRNTGPAGGLPPDHRPTVRQLAELRRYAGGFWAREARDRNDPVNRYIDAQEGCTCWPLPWRADCPSHGGEGAGGEELPRPKSESPEEPSED